MRFLPCVMLVLLTGSYLTPWCPAQENDPFGTPAQENDPFGTPAQENDPFGDLAKENDPLENNPFGSDPTETATAKEPDLVEELKLMLLAEFPKASIRLRPLNSSVVLSGTVEHPQAVSTIVRMAEEFYPKVINNLRMASIAAEDQNRLDLRILKLRHVHAEEAAKTIRELYSELFDRGLKAETNRDLNVIVMRGEREAVHEVMSLLTELDAMSADRRQPGPSAAQRVEADINQEIWRQKLSALARDYAGLTSAPPDPEGGEKKLAKLLAELRETVEEAFDARQQVQRQQVQRLQQRLATLQEKIEQRSRDRDRIVETMVEEFKTGGLPGTKLNRLLTPATPAAAALPTAGTPAQPVATANPPVPPAAVAAVPRIPDVEDLKLTADVKLLENQLARSKAQFLAGRLPAGEYESLQSQLDLRKQQVEALRAAYATQVERLKLQLAEAEAEHEYAAASFGAARDAERKVLNSVSEGELRKSLLQLRQAELAVQRAKLDLKAAQARQEALLENTPPKEAEE